MELPSSLPSDVAPSFLRTFQPDRLTFHCRNRTLYASVNPEYFSASDGRS